MGAHCYSFKDINRINELIKVSDEVLGKNYLTKNTIQSYIEDSSCSIDVIELNHVIIGFVMIYTVFNQNLKKHLLSEEESIINHFPDKSFINWFKIIAVGNKFQRKGFGQQLFNYSYERNNLITPYWLSIAWATRNKVHVASLLKKYHFQKKDLLEKYWYEDSFIHKYLCAKCGNPPCKCSAYIYRKK
jgi:hypothetical protein